MIYHRYRTAGAPYVRRCRPRGGAGSYDHKVVDLHVVSSLPCVEADDSRVGRQSAGSIGERATFRQRGDRAFRASMRASAHFVEIDDYVFSTVAETRCASLRWFD